MEDGTDKSPEMEIATSIIDVEVKDLIPADWNYKKDGSDARNDKLKESILQDRSAGILAVRELEDGTYEIIDGNHRLKSILKLGVPKLKVENFGKISKADAILVARRRNFSWFEDDLVQLGKLLDEVVLDEYSIDDLIEFMPDDRSDIEKLIKLNDNRFDEDNDDAKAAELLNNKAELRAKWKAEIGQLWQLGDHRLICGDSREADVVNRLFAGEKPFIMVTDPPYGVNYDPAWRSEAAEKGSLDFAPTRTGTVLNDDIADWSQTYALFEGQVMYAWSPAGDLLLQTGAAIQKVNFQIRTMIIWAKSNFPISRGHYTFQHEPCWYAVKKGKTSKWVGDNSESTLWKIALDKNVDGGHSTQKPLECMRRPISNHGDSTDSVYDPFVGSGTTLIACEFEKRRGYAVELDPEYLAVVLERYKELTGIEPKLIDE